jgi:predicted ABC-type transport system involved in lysophospholipase L1 biosynthesis ATPase subunit
VRSAAEVLDVFSGLREAGRAIVLVTHDRAVAARADRILILENGRVIDGTGRTSTE